MAGVSSRAETMINQLIRTAHRADGIFGEFWFEGDDEAFMVTLEHAYQNDDGIYEPKLPAGTYTCKRGYHNLHSGPVETFEVLNVPGHSGILCCHVGNYNADSEGCVLAGTMIDTIGGTFVLGSSRSKYKEFMKRLEGVDEFTLVVP